MTIKKSFIIVALAALFVSLPVCAKEKSLGEYLDDPLLKSAVSAYVIRDLDTGEMLFSVNPEKVMLPASNMKIITGAAALLALRPLYKFQTDYFTKNFDAGSGISNGLYVRGYGDPTLKEDFYGSAGAGMDRHAKALYDAGVRSVKGTLWVDGSFFKGNERPESWEKEDLQWCYASRPGALSVGDNCLRVTVTGDAKAGRAAKVTIDPPLDPDMLTVLVNTVTKGCTCVEITQNAAGRITISGTALKGKSGEFEYVVPRPELLYGSALKAALKRAGISVSADLRVRADVPEGYQAFLRMESMPLSQVLAEMGKESDNFVAEQVLLLLGALKSRGGDHESGAAAIGEILKKYELASEKTLAVADGSGLSRKNRLTPQVLIAVLSSFYNSYLKEEMVGMLAQPGEKGTMKKRVPEAKGRLWAKTGAIRGVCALSGYYRRENGNMAAFVIIMNGYTVHSGTIRNLQNEMIGRMLKI